MNHPIYGIKNLIASMLLLLLLAATSSAADGQRFKENSDGTVTDIKTGLMWASNDNGVDIDYDNAREYCKTFSVGGYDDWRLPDIEELQELFDANIRKTSGYGITSKIKLSSCCLWSSYDSTGVSSLLDFRSGKEIWSYKGDKEILRVLPVRGEEK